MGLNILKKTKIVKNKITILLPIVIIFLSSFNTKTSNNKSFRSIRHQTYKGITGTYTERIDLRSITIDNPSPNREKCEIVKKNNKFFLNIYGSSIELELDGFGGNQLYPKKSFYNFKGNFTKNYKNKVKLYRLKAEIKHGRTGDDEPRGDFTLLKLRFYEIKKGKSKLYKSIVFYKRMDFD